MPKFSCSRSSINGLFALLSLLPLITYGAQEGATKVRPATEVQKISNCPSKKSLQIGGALQGNALSLKGIVSTLPAAEGVAVQGFKNPFAITTDGTNLYVADRSNNIIRKIEINSGAVTTLAGVATSSGSANGSGAAATFDSPTGITTDGTYLFVTDTDNHTIRKVAIDSGLVTTLAGTPGVNGSTDATGAAASFDSPTGITTDGTHLFVADSYNHAIRKIAISTGEVTTLAGNFAEAGSTDGTGAAASFDRPSGLTTDGKNLYVTDQRNHNVRKIVIATGEVTTLAGTTGKPGKLDGVGSAASFSFPENITTDGTHLYVADSNNNNIRKIAITTGDVTTLVGNDSGLDVAASFNYPAGITSDGSNLFVADTANNTIRKIY